MTVSRPSRSIPSRTRQRFSGIVETLLSWMDGRGRPVVWRGARPKPYVVFVSEIMLQQTGAAYVMRKLPEFLRQFPTIHSLAAAPQSSVVLAWRGLGYNRRALNLHAAAKLLCSEYHGRFPKQFELLRRLPGVGEYTANAILSFAYRMDVAVVDVNIERVLSRLWQPMRSLESTLPMRDIRSLDLAILPSGASHRWHEAVMNFGGAICTKRAPQCGTCPLRTMCPSARYLEHATPAQSSAKETTYFGAPRRIWRGRVLKLISESNGIRIGALVAMLSTNDDSTFPAFVRTVVTQLQRDGLIAARRGVWRLVD